MPGIDVNLDQEKLQSEGVAAFAAAGTVNAYFAPQRVGSILLASGEVSDDISVQFSQETTDSIDDLRTLNVPTNTGRIVPLSRVASIEEVEEPISIKRLDGKRVSTVNIAMEEGADIAATNTAIDEFLSEDTLREFGLEKDALTFGGEFADFESDYSNLQIVFLLAMLGVYLILVYQFHSYFQPLIILFAVPLALIGVFPGLLTVGSSLNMISGLGIVALVGIVVNDAIVFIATMNRYREEYPEDSMYENLVRTGRSRFKPIFSTSITTIGGILPLTIYDPFWTGLGTSIVAGLIFSTIGTLVSIPVLYAIIKSSSSWIRAKLRRNKKQTA